VTISGHTQGGVDAQGASSVLIDAGTVISGNTGNGIILQDASVLAAWGGSTSPQITSNGQRRVYCNATPAVAQISGSLGTTVVTGNGAGAIRCPGY